MLETWRIKKGDRVVVTTGKDKGKVSEILQVIRKDDRILVKDVNVKIKNTKASAESQGGQVKSERSIHVSNVMHADPKDDKPTRIGVKVVDGKKVRFAKRSGETIDKK